MKTGYFVQLRTGEAEALNLVVCQFCLARIKKLFILEEDDVVEREVVSERCFLCNKFIKKIRIQRDARTLTLKIQSELYDKLSVEAFRRKKTKTALLEEALTAYFSS